MHLRQLLSADFDFGALRYPEYENRAAFLSITDEFSNPRITKLNYSCAEICQFIRSGLILFSDNFNATRGPARFPRAFYILHELKCHGNLSLKLSFYRTENNEWLGKGNRTQKLYY